MSALSGRIAIVFAVNINPHISVRAGERCMRTPVEIRSALSHLICP